MPPDFLFSNPSAFLMDIGGWTVDIMRVDGTT